MTTEQGDLWMRAQRALQTARETSTDDPDAIASRAYYAVFYAASAWLAQYCQTYSKHSGIEAAVHRDLVKPGIIPAELGAHYSWLASLRNTGDYGGPSHVSVEDASQALTRATEFIDAIAKLLE